ncbi:CynX/NimT family MFS transporter [Nocardioides daeguensis]|uniref:CynX/NimT family MFS transporter n=1 Tax=Nocardioides daeguensis TaxID=908359 RepID=A0ABP6WE70_9ACTN|nr:MFS transporter [Nocardioides daeguensis]MBV6728056.1 MFS transporter [Nocardioides daeguensis]MCR1774130.1 MFS transporter [Nocardioides daeguensis]
MTATTSVDAAQDTSLQRLLVVLGIVVLAFNLRPAASSVGPLLEEIRGGVPLGDTEAGLLTTLPVICFALVGGLAPRLASWLGLHRVTLLGLLLLAGCLWGRGQVHQGWLFLVLSFAALAGAASANVLMPSLVKLHFPQRVGQLTAVYTTSMAVGLTASSALSVPIATAGGGEVDYARGLGAWAVTAAIAVLPWIGLLGHDLHEGRRPHSLGVSAIARTRLGWAMAGAFGLQSLQAYAVFGWFAQMCRDAGYSAEAAGVLLGVVTGASIPLSLLIPVLAGRLRDQRWLLTALMACYPVGYLGFLADPRPLGWLWALAIGCGASTFPLILTLIGLRSRTPEGTAALSGFTQSAGYLIAAAGPFGVGLLHAATGGWTVPVLVLLALCVPLYLCGLYATRDRYVEDELGPRG